MFCVVNIKINNIHFFLFRLLGLDMVVRDEQGNILNPLHTPTIQLYKHHEIATERIQNSHVKFVFV